MKEVKKNDLYNLDALEDKYILKKKEAERDGFNVNVFSRQSPRLSRGRERITLRIRWHNYDLGRTYIQLLACGKIWEI